MLHLVIDSSNYEYPVLRPKNRQSNKQNQQSLDHLQCNHDTNPEVVSENYPDHHLITPRRLLKGVPRCGVDREVSLSASVSNHWTFNLTRSVTPLLVGTLWYDSSSHNRKTCDFTPSRRQFSLTVCYQYPMPFSIIPSLWEIMHMHTASWRRLGATLWESIAYERRIGNFWQKTS